MKLFLMYICIKLSFVFFILTHANIKKLQRMSLDLKFEEDTGEFTVAFYLESLKGNQANIFPFQIHDNILKMVPHVGYSSIYLRKTNEQKLAVNYLRANLVLG